MIALKDLQSHAIKLDPEQRASDIWLRELHFEKGKNYLILAPSGKGKSTLLHLIYGLRKDYDGAIQWDREDTRDFASDQWSRLRQHNLSIVYQDLRLFLPLTAWENIKIKAELVPFKSDEELKAIARQLGIEPLLDQSVRTLSYGQRQRLAIVRALSQPFDFILLDEPFSHLDEDNIRIACELITQACREQGAGMILVSLGEPFHFSYDQILTL